jgi:hypothetical protein
MPRHDHARRANEASGNQFRAVLMRDIDIDYIGITIFQIELLRRTNQAGILPVAQGFR